MLNPIISIVIVTYNAENYIEECINSILAQTYSSYNIIIVDNNSSDNTRRIIKKMMEHVDRIHLLQNNSNLGFSRACNFGIKHAFDVFRSKFILLLNQDTVIQENLLSELTLWHNKTGDGAYCPKILIKKNHTIWWIGTKFLNTKDLFKHINLSVSYHAGKEMEDTFLIKQPVEIEAITGCVLFLPKKIIDEVGYFDEQFFMYAEDLDYSIRLRKKGYKMYIIPNTVVYHDVPLTDEALKYKNNVIKTLKRYYHHFKSSLMLLKKHYTISYTAIWLFRAPLAVIYEFVKRAPVKKE